MDFHLVFFQFLFKFSVIVCDNCTLTLLESSDDLGYLIASETNLIDLNGIPAPWPRLLKFENSTKHLTMRLIDLLIAKEKIENYNDLQIDKVSAPLKLVYKKNVFSNV